MERFPRFLCPGIHIHVPLLMGQFCCYQLFLGTLAVFSQRKILGANLPWQTSDSKVWFAIPGSIPRGPGVLQGPCHFVELGKQDSRGNQGSIVSRSWITLIAVSAARLDMQCVLVGKRWQEELELFHFAAKATWALAHLRMFLLFGLSNRRLLNPQHYWINERMKDMLLHPFDLWWVWCIQAGDGALATFNSTPPFRSWHLYTVCASGCVRLYVPTCFVIIYHIYINIYYDIYIYTYI